VSLVSFPNLAGSSSFPHSCPRSRHKMNLRTISITGREKCPVASMIQFMKEVMYTN
jgi:hypothetical protein